MALVPRKAILTATLIVMAAGPARPAHADNLGKGLLLLLEDFGYQFSGTRSFIRQGFSINASRNFTNSEFDYGMARLTLNGPLSFQFEAAKRFGPSAEFSVSTLNQPLSYNLDINTGFQDFTAVGALLINSTAEINPLGFYDFGLFVSNRGTFTADGFLLVDSGTLDYDIGPVNTSGNIFIDALAVLTEPFWVAAGQPNPLAKISGRATKEAALTKKVDEVQGKVNAGLALADEDMQALIDATVLAAVLGLEAPDLSFLEEANLDELTTTTTADGTVLFGDNPNALLTVPEPSVAVLIIGPVLVWAGTHRRRQSPHS